MLEALRIRVDRLAEGEVQQIKGSFDPSFLEVEEKELQFRLPVSVQSQVYLAEKHLLIHMWASTRARMPCSICNEMVETELRVNNFIHSMPLEEISEPFFDCSLPLREALLLELPQYVECCSGSCPERASLSPYLRPHSKESEPHHPFSGLEYNE